MIDRYWPVVPFHSCSRKQSLSGTSGPLWGAMTIAYFRPEAVTQSVAANDKVRLEANIGRVAIVNFLLTHDIATLY